METKGSFAHALKTGNYKSAAQFLVLAGFNAYHSLEDTINSLYNEYVRLSRDEEKRLKERLKIDDVKVGDSVTIIGLGRIDKSQYGMVGRVAYLDSGKIKFKVVSISISSVSIVYADDDSIQWTVHKNSITSVTPADPRLVWKVRGKDRRVQGQYMVSSGTDLHIVTCLESVDKLHGPLNEDQREVLAQAQALVRSDNTANGFRKGLDRRKF